MEYQKRADVPEKYKFDLQEYFKNIDDWNEKYNESLNQIDKLKDYKGKLKDAKKLEEFLKLYIYLSNEILDLSSYAVLCHDVELEKEEYTELLNKSDELSTKLELICSFWEPEIVEFTKEEYQSLFTQNPNLKEYIAYLDEIYREKEHTLSEKEEEIVTTLSQTFNSFQNISSTLLNSEHSYGSIKLEDGSVIKIAPNNLVSLKRNPSSSIRKKAQKQFGNTIAQYQKTESSLLYYHIKNNINLAKIHNFESPWKQKLHIYHMPDSVFENMKKVAKEKKEAWQNYFRLMKKVLNLKTLHNYDTSLEWSKNTKNYSIEEAQNIIKEALKPLGKDYLKKLSKVFDNHYIDYCQYKGKVSGGYSLYTYNHNSRIVINYKESFQDVLTIAHEIGHNIHHQYITENNPVWYRSSSSFYAEVASLTNEFLLNHYIAEYGKTNEEKRVGLEHTLKTFQNNFFSAILEGEMEQKMYEHVEKGETITATYLKNLAENALKEYQGTVVKNDDVAKYCWVTRSHYYLNFYLYSYALCVSIAAILAGKICNKEPGVIEKYQEFLKCGSNNTPTEIYQTLGIDLNDEKIFEEAIEYFKEQLITYEKLWEGGTNE